MPTSPTLREAAQAVSDQADPDDDFEGQFYQYLVPHDAIVNLRAALGAAQPPLDVDEALRDFVALLPPERWHLLRPATQATVAARLGAVDAYDERAHR